MTDLVPFDFKGKPLSVVGTFEDPLFDATEACAILEYANPHDAMSRHVEKDDLVKREVIDSLGRKQKKSYLREPGWWSLLMRANTSEAKEVQRWFTHQVLPALRKTGTYSTPRARMVSAQVERRKTLQALAKLVDKAQDGALRDLLRSAASRTVDLLVPPPTGQSPTTAAAPDDLGWQSADFVAKASSLNASLVGKIASQIGLRDPRFEDRGIVRLGRQTLSEYQKDVPLWQYSGPALTLLIDACRAYKSGKFPGLAELGESQAYNAFRILSP